jgi:hypothetical protein
MTGDSFDQLRHQAYPGRREADDNHAKVIEGPRGASPSRSEAHSPTVLSRADLVCIAAVLADRLEIRGTLRSRDEAHG